MIIVYTKPNCIFCEKAKSLLTSYDLPFQERDITTSTNKQELLLLLPQAKTVPQIWVDEQYIGGYSELSEYL